MFFRKKHPYRVSILVADLYDHMLALEKFSGRHDVEVLYMFGNARPSGKDIIVTRFRYSQALAGALAVVFDNELIEIQSRLDRDQILVVAEFEHVSLGRASP